jgi:hypothetical protein
MGALKLGMKQGLQGQTRAPGKGDFKDNSKGLLEVLNTLLTLYHHHSVFSWTNFCGFF